MREISRTELVNGNFVFPSEMVKLVPTKHFIDRLEERGIGLDCIPTIVRVTKDNLHSAKTEDGKILYSVVVRLKYSSTKYIFLAFNPIDGALKTLWFKDRYGNRGRIDTGDSGQAVRDNRSEENVRRDT